MKLRPTRDTKSVVRLARPLSPIPSPVDVPSSVLPALQASFAPRRSSAPLRSLPSPLLPLHENQSVEMFAAKSSLFLLAAAAAPALAPVYVTSPVASTSWAAGSQVSINWQDDGTSPSLSEFGASKVSVYVGSKTQQVSYCFLLVHSANRRRWWDRRGGVRRQRLRMKDGDGRTNVLCIISLMRRRSVLADCSLGIRPSPSA